MSLSRGFSSVKLAGRVQYVRCGDANYAVQLVIRKLTEGSVRFITASYSAVMAQNSIVREYVFYVFLKIQKNATFYVFLKRLSKKRKKT